MAGEAMRQARLGLRPGDPHMPPHPRRQLHPVGRLTASWSTPSPGHLQPDLPRRGAIKAARQWPAHPDGATIHAGLGAHGPGGLGELGGARTWGCTATALTDVSASHRERGDHRLGEDPAPPQDRGLLCLGGQRLFHFVNKTPSAMLPTRLINAPGGDRPKPPQISVHEALEVDLTGQVCSADRVRPGLLGHGRVVDFLRGASASPGGQGS